MDVNNPFIERLRWMKSWLSQSDGAHIRFSLDSIDHDRSVMNATKENDKEPRNGA